MSIFKSGSIRGRWTVDWNEDTVFRIGYHLADMFGWKNVVIGRDGRNSSETVLENLVKGLNLGGCSATSIGMVDTPAISFSNITYQYDGSVMITASHNPVDYNGMKISGKNALVISRKNGLAELEQRVTHDVAKKDEDTQNSYKDIRADYLRFLADYREGIGNLKCVIDCSNGMAGILIHSIIKDLPGTYTFINDEIDGNFPGHGPDPTNIKNLESLISTVADTGADLGVCFDGDGDRVIFVDEKGRWISPDIILGVIGLYYFRHKPELVNGRNAVLYDARCSNSVKDYMQFLGVESFICSTGHTAMQVGMPEKNAIFGGELPGHYYYADYYALDNGWIPFLQVLATLNLESRPFSEIVDEIDIYSFSGEINFNIPDGDVIIEQIKSSYSFGRQTYLDGVRVDFEDWWFLVRMANTEPVLRLVVEARTPDLLEDKVKELKAYLYSRGATDHHS